MDSGSVARLCPACAKPMARVLDGDTAVDRCERCGGAWFDCSKLGRVANMGPIAVENLLSKSKDWVPTVPAKKVLACPICMETLETHTFGSVQGLNVQACRICQGMFVTLDGLNHLRDWEMRRLTVPPLNRLAPIPEGHDLPAYMKVPGQRAQVQGQDDPVKLKGLQATMTQLNEDVSPAKFTWLQNLWSNILTSDEEGGEFYSGSGGIF